MRQLKLESPPLRGADVSDWQTFLIARGLLTVAANGVFGPKTSAATKAYQAAAGIPADGVAGPFTIARALQDGLTSTTEPLEPGMDARVNCAPHAAKIVAAGLRFVVRYYSKFPAKVLSRAEAKTLTTAGLSIVTVFQDSNHKLEFFTAAIGTQQARKALTLASALGQPSGSAIYFAADFDPAPAEVRGPVMEYFHAVADEMAASSYTVGVYGSGLTCRLIRDAGFARLTWLAQSTGFREYKAFLPQADIVQAVPSRALIPGRLDIDDNIAQSANFGAFRVS